MPRAASVRSIGRTTLAVILSAALFGPLHGGLAVAQSKDELAKAREQFREGLALEAGGNYAKALEVFKVIAEVKSTPQLRMHIAQCEEKTGDYLKALGSYRLALVDAQAAKLKDVIQLANESIAALEPKIPALTLQRGDGATVASMKLDQRVLGATEIGAKVAVNPGPHVIEASAPGKRPFRVEVLLADGERKTIEVSLVPEPIKDDPIPPTDPTAAPTAPPPPPPSSSPLRPAGFAVGGLGLVGLAIGGAFIGVRQGTLSELESKCGADHKSCPPDASNLVARGETESNVVTGMMITGGVALAVGVVLILVAPKSAPAKAPVVSGMRNGGTLSFSF